MDIGDFDALAWYRNIPPVSRAYLTATVAVTVLATLELLSPFDLYYNSTLIMQGQVWRLATSFLFFGQLGLGFFLNMFFTMQQCIALEQGFGGAGGTADFLFFVLLAAAGLLACAPLVTVTFFSTAFMQVIVYVWSKRNPHAGMALFGVVPFPRRVAAVRAHRHVTGVRPQPGDGAAGHRRGPLAATTLLLLPADALHAAPWRQGPVAALEADLAMRGRLARGLPDGEGAGASSLGGSAAFGARAAGWQAGSMVASLAIAFVAVAGVAAGSGSGQNRAVGAMWQAVVRTAGLSIAAITLTASVTLGLDKSLVVGPVTVPASTMVAASSVYSWLALPWPSRPARALAWHEHLRSGLALLGFLRPVVLLGPGRVPGVPNSVFVPFTVVVVLALVGLRLLVERRPTAAPEVDTDGTELARQQDSSHGLPSPSLSPSEVWVAAVATMTALPAAVAIVSTTFRANTAAALPLPLHPACVSPAQGGWPLAAPSSAHGRDPAPVCAGSCWELPLTACPSERTMELVSLSLIITTHLAGALLAAYSVHALSMTQTRVLASQLEASKQRVLASNQGLRQFLGFVSHEVRNPLAAAQLAIDAAAIRFAPEQAKAGARAAPTEAERPGLPLASPAGGALTTGLASPFPPAPRADCEGLQQDFRDVLDEIQASLSAARAVLDDVLEYQSIMHSDAATREGQGATALGGRVRLTPRWFQASLVTSQVALVFGAGARVSGVRLQVSLSLERDASDGGEASTRSGTSGSGLTAGVAAGDRSTAGPGGDADDEAPEPAWLQVSVKDEGKGMTKDESSKLFSRFGRLEGADDGLSAAGSRMRVALRRPHARGRQPR
ncbi:hypothetical protein FNF28_07606 [Cafeteria roenbergensis]|uniref:Signal transduction histidine kinase dimerisation/phosphoacceptor domain-containing protein n=1 Tax=Cafeteria roenbergensis TaxID=33653 RepID=A0A5A8C213_CAFRO|nr:hypothetical protein FNF28_07606 [Cafeteria roenbergensis]